MQFIEHESETVEQAKSHTEYNMRELVGEEVDTWDKEKRREEALRSAEIILSELSYHPELQAVLQDRARTLFQYDMPRIPMNHLATDKKSEVVKCMNYWPNDMDKWECRDMIDEMGIHDIPSEYLDRAHEEVSTGIVRKLMEFDD